MKLFVLFAQKSNNVGIKYKNNSNTRAAKSNEKTIGFNVFLFKSFDINSQ
tara:strand:+ start:577 stop:726 length:150 start_codon:yes stop_codon:yes gene_type:complete